MKLNAPMLYHRMQQYFKVDSSHISQNNWVKTPMFYNTFFDMDEHLILVDAEDVCDCLQRVEHAVIICLAPPEEDVTELVGNNDLIVLNDPMSQRMAFNILNHILDYYQEFEQALNGILHTSHSFQDMIEEITRVVELPLALTDANFRYIAYSASSGRYIEEYVTASNGVPESVVVAYKNRENTREMENIQTAYLATIAEPSVCRNIFHEQEYIGRLVTIIPDEETDTEYIRAIFDYAVPFIEILYGQYNSFSNVSMEYREVHEFLDRIFRRQAADPQAFAALMRQMHVEAADDLRVVNLIPWQDGSSLYSSVYTCEHLERVFPGCFCVSIEEELVMLASTTTYEAVTGQQFTKELEMEVRNLRLVGGISRVFHSLTVFETISSAQSQAVYARKQMAGDNDSSVSRSLYAFDDYALEYLMEYGSAGANLMQNGHPALIVLKEHDEKNETSYLETLRVYMDVNMNAVAAAGQLYIHRSSFINRMERIHKLVDLDLNDPKERLYVNLSFAVFFR